MGTEGTGAWRGQGHEGYKGMEGLRAWMGQGYGGDKGI